MGVTGRVEGFGLTDVTRSVAYGQTLGIKARSVDIESGTVVESVGRTVASAHRRGEYRSGGVRTYK